MTELIRIILLLAIVGAAVTFIGSAVVWWMDDRRRLLRLVRKVLGGQPDGVIIAPGRGQAAGFRLASGQAVVMREGGANALLYPLHALIGAELIVDDDVAARVMRDEPRRVLDSVRSGAQMVTLRLLFDDARYPDFSLDLWIPRDGLRRDAPTPAAAIREARGWLARAEAIMRKTARTASPAHPVPPAGGWPQHASVTPAEWEVDPDNEAEDAPFDPSEEPRLL